MFLAILLPVSFMYSFHVKCWSHKNPRNLIDSSLCISKVIDEKFEKEGYRIFYLPYGRMSILIFPQLKKIYLQRTTLLFYVY